jgi:hypothetical protein
LSETTTGATKEADKVAIEAVAGSNVFAYPRRHVKEVDGLQHLLDLPADQLIAKLVSKGNTHSTIYKKGYWGDRSIELVSHLWRIHPASLLEALGNAPASPRWIETTAWRIVSAAMAFAVGRIRPEGFFVETREIVPADLFAAPQVDTRTRQPDARAILVDDPGHQFDVVRGVEEAIATHFTQGAPDDVVRALSAGRSTTLREFIASSFFSRHLSEYSDYRREAPVYWQLSTPSTRFSAWIYLHALTKDTFYNLQNDFVTPKLLHEERTLEAIRLEYGQSPTAAERKLLAAQASFVEELRTFLDEVKRIAPLYSPSLDDGVVVSFSPLWRLVPHQNAWQRELKTAWDSLCRGDYDWSHLAMHLWPERVVPKCAADRSLAIAHGLDNVFWVEGDDGKWASRLAPTRPVEDLVRERTSIAVKAALKNLLEAPAANGNGGRARGRRVANAVADGGSH